MPKTILIVEDEADVRQAYQDGIAAAGYHVITAANGADGLAQAKTNRPDLILVDLLMPVITGLEMLKTLRGQDWGQDIKVVVLTNSGEIEDIVKSLQSLVADYFIKAETSLETLLSAIKGLIGEPDSSVDDAQ